MSTLDSLCAVLSPTHLLFFSDETDTELQCHVSTKRSGFLCTIVSIQPNSSKLAEDVWPCLNTHFLHIITEMYVQKGLRDDANFAKSGSGR